MIYTEEEINLITLSSFKELTYDHRKSLLSDLTSANPDFAKYEKNLIKSLSCGVYNKIRANYSDADYRNNVLAGLEKRGVVCITYFSKDYPEKLKTTPAPPIVLYTKGNRELLKTNCFSIVGSRRTQPNMLKLCKKTAEEISQHFTVVTGIADGADSAAIEGALPCGKIISVLAYGFDHVYPAMNERLLKKVETCGLVITEYPPEIAPQKHFFPIRNRIIAALSVGTLIVSAGVKSGTLSTAGYTSEYGRELFAFPYGIGVSSGVGCNYLLKNNYATIVENSLDIFDNLNIDFKPQKHQLNISDEEEELLAAIRGAGEALVSELADLLGTQPYKLLPLISKLEINGLVVRLGGNRYACI